MESGHEALHRGMGDLGLDKAEVRLVPHDPRWVALGELECARVVELLGEIATFRAHCPVSVHPHPSIARHAQCTHNSNPTGVSPVGPQAVKSTTCRDGRWQGAMTAV